MTRPAARRRVDKPDAASEPPPACPRVLIAVQDSVQALQLLHLASPGGARPFFSSPQRARVSITAWSPSASSRDGASPASPRLVRRRRPSRSRHPIVAATAAPRASRLPTLALVRTAPSVAFEPATVCVSRPRRTPSSKSGLHSVGKSSASRQVSRHRSIHLATIMRCVAGSARALADTSLSAAVSPVPRRPHRSTSTRPPCPPPPRPTTSPTAPAAWTT